MAAFWSPTQGHLDSLLVAEDKEEDMCLDFSGNSLLPQEAAPCGGVGDVTPLTS